MALRDQPELEATPPLTRTGQGGANGQLGTDPAHRGPLPDATFAELVGRVINDVSDLADRQVELAKQEITDTRDEATAIAIKIGIGAGMVVACALFLVIWAWTAFIWFFNWLGSFVSIGPVTLAWFGWFMGIVVPVATAYLAYRLYISVGIERMRHAWPPLVRTRESLREDLEWVRRLRTPNAR